MRRVFIPIAAVIALGAILAPLAGTSEAEAAVSSQRVSHPAGALVQLKDAPRILPWEEQQAAASESHAQIVASCKSDLPYAKADGWTASKWLAFCDGLPAPVVSEYVVYDPTTGEVW